MPGFRYTALNARQHAIAATFTLQAVMPFAQLID